MSENDLKIKIRDLLLSNDFKKLSEIKDEVNIFKIINMVDKEAMHSDILAWLFNPYENHNLNDKAVKGLLMQLSENDAEYINLLLLNYSDLEVYREYTIDNCRRIDILMESRNNKVILIIENKIWSGEGDNQLEDYKKFIDEKYNDYNRIFLYLTPEKERKEKYKGYTHITYNTIYKIINNILYDNQIKLEIRALLKQYKEIIRINIMGNVDKEMIDLCRKLYVEHKEALDKIMQYGNTTYYLTEVINDILQSEPYNEGKVLKKNYGDIVYLPKCNDKVSKKLQCGFQEDNYYIALSIKIIISNDYIKIRLQASGINKDVDDMQYQNYLHIKNKIEKDFGISINNDGWYIINQDTLKININNNEDTIKELNIILNKYINKFNEIIKCFDEKI